MKLTTVDGSPLWLTYCMNVHPGGDLAATYDALENVVGPLRQRLGVRGPFGLGIRWDESTVTELVAEPGRLERLAARLEDQRLVPFTANAFVLGRFHGQPIKEEVYRPDWREPERLAYTLGVARLLVRLAPGERRLSISTAPGSWRAWGAGAEGEAASAGNLVRAAEGLRQLFDETGVLVRLGLEPEPGCTIETTDEAVAFFEGPLARALRGREGLRSHLGVCFDVCHQAVVHEDVLASLDRLAERGVPVVKVQASSALEVADPEEPGARADLAAFDEEVYLHQVGARDADGSLHVSPDLSDALAGGADWAAWKPWRVHFHVPVFRERARGLLGTTRRLLEQVLRRVATGGVTDHLEIETYTWNVFPDADEEPGSRTPDLVEGLGEEYRWVLGVLDRAGTRPVDGGLEGSS